MNNKYLYILKALKIPPARLTLKIGTPVILIRNINSAKRFYNNTRYIIKGKEDIKK